MRFDVQTLVIALLLAFVVMLAYLRGRTAGYDEALDATRSLVSRDGKQK